MNNVRPFLVMCYTESSQQHQTPVLVSATALHKVPTLPAFNVLHRKGRNMQSMCVLALYATGRLFLFSWKQNLNS